MRPEFVQSVLTSLLEAAVISRENSVLAVCAHHAERQVFLGLGFAEVTISNLDKCLGNFDFKPYAWSVQNAEALTFQDGEFDFAFVSDGLHHCSSPHRALLEMYRVSRKGVIAVEARDSLLMRLATRLGLSQAYEVGDGRGGLGVGGTSVPNYIYRWTEREFKKTLQSWDPTGRHDFRFMYELNLPPQRIMKTKSRPRRAAIRLAAPLAMLCSLAFKKQCNSLAMIALKPQAPDDLWPWIRGSGTGG